MSVRYVHLPRPWRAVVDPRSDRPARFLAAMLEHQLRFGLPAARRFGGLWAVLGRRGLPRGALAAALRAGPRRGRADLDDLRAEVARRWDELASRSDRLPGAPPELTVLALQRSAALTVFLFGEAAHPLLVGKIPREDSSKVQLEAEALEEATVAGVAPRFLGQVGGAWMQEGLAGGPLAVEPLDPDRARDLRWTDSQERIAEALARLASATARDEPPREIAGLVERAIAEGPVLPQTRSALEAAHRDVEALDRSVLRHGDTGPQNVHFDGPRLVGVVDWETARRGVPGFDSLIASASFVEQGVGLARWTQDMVVATFRAAWSASEFGSEARRAARRAMTAGGIDERHHDQVELVLFARRLGARLARPDAYDTTPQTAARILDLVAGS